MSLLTRLASGQRSTELARTHGQRSPAVGTASVTYSSPGMPQMPLWDGRSAVDQGYYGHIYVMRCVRTIADTIAGLAIRAGDNPATPDVHNPNAPIARLLGPAPGGPNPTSSARALIAWSVVQYLVTGKYGWETEPDEQGRVAALWPLVAYYLNPIPSSNASQWWQGFQYNLPTGIRTLPADRVHYAWRPSARDWHQPESVLEAARLPISVAIGIDRYNWALLKNNMVASHLVVTPPFAESESRRAFQDQFLAEFTGFDNAGRTAFAEMDVDPGEKVPTVQVQQLGQTAENAQLSALSQTAKHDINIALGVPESIIGDSSRRTYENADQEHRNYWTGTILPLCLELADQINMSLAPRLGNEIMWFDFSQVQALQPPRMFAGADPVALVGAKILTGDEVRDDLGFSPLDPNHKPPSEPLPSVDDTPGGSHVGSGAGGRAAEDMAAVVARLEAVAESWGLRKPADGGHPADAERLQRYWAEGEGAAKIGWGTPGDFDRCRVELGKYVGPERVDGTCANLHHRATGFWPGHAPSEQTGGRDAMTESGAASVLLPVAPVPKPPVPRETPHLFRPGPERKCRTCGHTVGHPLHMKALSGYRHAGPGHRPAQTGHVKSRGQLRAATRAEVARHADTLEPQLTDVMRRLFARQQKGTLDRLSGRRGAQMVRAAQPNPGDAAVPASVDPGAVFDTAFWTSETLAALGPIYSAAQAMTETRLAGDLHPGVPTSPAVVDAVRAALDARGQALAGWVTDTTWRALADTLAEGVNNGESITQLAKRVRGVFTEAEQVRAEVIARTEVLSALNSAGAAYAANLPPGIVAAKEWLATPDARTREAHRLANGQRRLVGEPFLVGGEPLMQPGDPTGTPGNVIQCRCVALYIPARMVGTPALQAA